jgi:hypothetical protein
MRKTVMRLTLISALCLGLAGCEDPQIYGSVGFSSYSGNGWGGGGMGTSISIGGRIR